MLARLVLLCGLCVFLWSSFPAAHWMALADTASSTAASSTAASSTASSSTPSSSSVNQAVVNSFYMALTEKTIDVSYLKKLLKDIPVEDQIFKSLNKYLSPNPPRSTEEDEDKNKASSPMATFPILHHLLNHYMLAKSIETKVDIVEVMHLGIAHGLDISIPLNNDPALFVKTLMVREMELSSHVLQAGGKYVTNELIARSTRMSRFFATLYGITTEVVPIAKLLLHVEKLTQTYMGRMIENTQNSTMIALAFLSKARLEKPTILAPELIKFSPRYKQLVEHITTYSMNQVDELQREDMLEMTKIISLQDIMMSLNDLVMLLMREVFNAMEHSDRRIVAIEHFLELHIIADAQERNLFHYLMAGNHVLMLEELYNLFIKLQQEVSNHSQDENTDADPLNPNKIDSAKLSFLAQKVIMNVQQVDVRGHTPLSYATIRYGEEAEVTVAYKKLMGLLADLAFDNQINQYELDDIEGLGEGFIEEDEEEVPIHSENAKVNSESESPKTIEEEPCTLKEDGTCEEDDEDMEEVVTVEEVIEVASDVLEQAILEEVPNEMPEDTPAILPSREIPESDDGGWSTERLELAALKKLEGKTSVNNDDGKNHYGRCDILEVWDSNLPGLDEFFVRYINTATPVIFRGAALRNDSSMNALRKAFAKKRFVRTYGSVAVPAASIPYGDSFGVPSNTKTLKEVANSDAVVTPTGKNGNNERVSIPLYTFTTANQQWAQKLNRDVPFPEPLQKEVEPDEKKKGKKDASTKMTIEAAYSFELQFYLGPAGTGAPVHFHGHAMNTLAYGEKVSRFSFLLKLILILFHFLYRNGYYILQVKVSTLVFQL